MTPLEFLAYSGLQSGSLLERLLSLEILYARQQGYHMPTHWMCRTQTFVGSRALGGPWWACVACAFPTFGQDDEEDDDEFGLDLQVALCLSRGRELSEDLDGGGRKTQLSAASTRGPSIFLHRLSNRAGRLVLL